MRWESTFVVVVVLIDSCFEGVWLCFIIPMDQKSWTQSVTLSMSLAAPVRPSSSRCGFILLYRRIERVGLNLSSMSLAAPLFLKEIDQVKQGKNQTKCDDLQRESRSHVCG